MKQFLNEIQQLVNQSEKRGVYTFEGLPSKIIMHKPAFEEDIYNLKKALPAGLPEDYISFLEYSNGGVLFKIEDFAGYKLFSINELFRENSFQKQNFGKDWNDTIVLFCQCVGDNEYLALKYNESNYEIIYCIMELLPTEWQIIEKDFGDLIHNLILKRGEKYWLK